MAKPRPEDVVDLTMSDTDEKEPTQQYAAAQQQAPDDTAHYEHDYADPDDDDYEPQTEEEREQMFISKTIKDCHDTIDQFNHHNSRTGHVACPEDADPVVRDLYRRYNKALGVYANELLKAIYPLIREDRDSLWDAQRAVVDMITTRVCTTLSGMSSAIRAYETFGKLPDGCILLPEDPNNDYTYKRNMRLYDRRGD